jgi:endonuclease/exonuclease/phosphatase family metal-dependent hydrolase
MEEEILTLESVKSIKLMSFNIHGGRARDGLRDITRIVQLLDEMDIDIAVFQEVETRVSRGGCNEDINTLSGSNRPHHVIAPSIIHHDGWYGNLIVSKYPVLRGLVHNLETTAQYEPRNAVDALIETPLGKIRVIGTHLSLSIFERRSEARNLIRLMDAVEEKEKNPILLMGDLNEWQMPSRLLKFLDSHLTPIACRASFPSWLPFLKLDRVWYHGNSLHVSAKTLSTKRVSKLSDHLPVMIEISAIF